MATTSYTAKNEDLVLADRKVTIQTCSSCYKNLDMNNVSSYWEPIMLIVKQNKKRVDIQPLFRQKGQLRGKKCEDNSEMIAAVEAF